MLHNLLRLGVTAALELVVLQSSYAATIASFTGGEFTYNGTTFTTATSGTNPGPSPLDSITSTVGIGYTGTAPMFLNISGVIPLGGYTVADGSGTQLFTGGTMTLSDSGGILLQGNFNTSKLTGPVNQTFGALFNFDIVEYTVISDALVSGGFAGSLPGTYVITQLNMTTAFPSTAGVMPSFSATGSGDFASEAVLPSGSVVPEPLSLALVGSALACVIGTRRFAQS